MKKIMLFILLMSFSLINAGIKVTSMIPTNTAGTLNPIEVRDNYYIDITTASLGEVSSSGQYEITSVRGWYFVLDAIDLSYKRAYYFTPTVETYAENGVTHARAVYTSYGHIGKEEIMNGCCIEITYTDLSRDVIHIVETSTESTGVLHPCVDIPSNTKSIYNYPSWPVPGSNAFIQPGFSDLVEEVGYTVIDQNGSVVASGVKNSVNGDNFVLDFTVPSSAKELTFSGYACSRRYPTHRSLATKTVVCDVSPSSLNIVARSTFTYNVAPGTSILVCSSTMTSEGLDNITMTIQAEANNGIWTNILTSSIGRNGTFTRTKYITDADYQDRDIRILLTGYDRYNGVRMAFGTPVTINP